MSNYKGNHKKKFLAQKGQVVVIIALLMVCLMGMAALVVDVGSLYQKRAFLQTVADSAALAGAQELPGSSVRAIEVAINYATRNDVNITSDDVVISKTLSPYYDTIKVTLSVPAPVYFAGVLGINTVDVGASATARVGEPKYVYNVVPWAAIVPNAAIKWNEQLVPGTEYWITTYSATNYRYSTSSFCAWYEASTLPSNWYTAIYQDRIINGYSINNIPTPLSVGNTGTIGVDTIYVQAIVMNDTVTPTNDRVAQVVWDLFNDLVSIEIIEEKEVYKLAKSGDTQLVIVPVIQGPLRPGRATSKASILAFAPFILEGIRGWGTNRQIYGRFIDQALIVYDGEVKGVEPAGLRVIRLIR